MYFIFNNKIFGNLRLNFSTSSIDYMKRNRSDSEDRRLMPPPFKRSAPSESTTSRSTDNPTSQLKSETKEYPNPMWVQNQKILEESKEDVEELKDDIKEVTNALKFMSIEGLSEEAQANNTALKEVKQRFSGHFD